jgi:hypothetical protein
VSTAIAVQHTFLLSISISFTSPMPPPAVFEIYEILCGIVGCIDPQRESGTLYSLALTDRSISEAALDVLWEAPPIDDLARRMSNALWIAEKLPDREIHPGREQMSLSSVGNKVKVTSYSLCAIASADTRDTRSA